MATTPAINPKTDTLWMIAYDKHDVGEIPRFRGPFNRAADQIIRHHRSMEVVGRALVAVSAILVALGMALIAYSLVSYSTKGISLWKFKLGMGLATVGICLSMPSGYNWYVGHKRFKEDQTKPIAEVYDYILGNDINDLELGVNGYGYLTTSVKKDAQLIKDALSAI